MRWTTTDGVAHHGDAKMDFVYVLMEEGWEYNDEVFFRPESGSGTPRAFFLTQEEADVECNKRNVQSFKDLWSDGEIRQYCYGLDEILPYEQRKDKDKKKLLNDTCEKIFGKDWSEVDDELSDQDRIQVLETATDEDWKQLFDLTNLNFWNVVEVEKA